MLTTDQVLDLVAAGFTAEEIKAYNEPSSLPPTDPEPELPPAAPDPEEAPEEEQPDTVSRTEFEEMKAAMQELTKVIKANNILTASKETTQKTLTVDEAADAAIRAFFNS